MKVNGTNYYIGRSQSGSYTTSDSILSTRANTRTSSGYSAQSYTYSRNVYTIIGYTTDFEEIFKAGYYISTYTYSNSYTVTDIDSKYYNGSYESTVRFWHAGENDGANTLYYSTVVNRGQQTLTSTNSVYYTTIITNGVYNITVSTAKSASSSSHNFV